MGHENFGIRELIEWGEKKEEYMIGWFRLRDKLVIIIVYF